MVTPRITPVISSVGNINESVLQDRGVDIQYDSSPKFNFDKGDFEISGGSPIMLTNKDNLMQWISKILSVPLNHYVVYSPFYGNALNNYMTRVPNEALQVITPRLIKEALLSDNRIVDVRNIITRIIMDRIYIKFTVITFDSDFINIENNWSLV